MYSLLFSAVRTPRMIDPDALSGSIRGSYVPVVFTVSLRSNFGVSEFVRRLVSYKDRLGDDQQSLDLRSYLCLPNPPNPNLQ